MKFYGNTHFVQFSKYYGYVVEEEVDFAEAFLDKYNNNFVFLTSRNQINLNTGPSGRCGNTGNIGKSGENGIIGQKGGTGGCIRDKQYEIYNIYFPELVYKCDPDDYDENEFYKQYLDIECYWPQYQIIDTTSYNISIPNPFPDDFVIVNVFDQNYRILT